MQAKAESQVKTDLQSNLCLITPAAFWKEFLLAAVFFAVVIIWAVWPLISAPDNTYPVTTDGMGHLTRVAYIADCLKNWKWPSWFPFWYNGSTVTQYYPPLSFALSALIQIFSENVKITFEVLIVFSQWLGAMGVWFFCYRFIGPWFGIFGGMFYGLQPFLLRTLVLQGAIAQGPIFALTPWFMLFSLLFFARKTPLMWLLVCILSLLLMFSQPMHFYLVGISMGIVALMLLIQRKILFSDLILWSAGILLGIGLGGFWAVPGITNLENPLIPYLLPETSANWAASLNWFNPIERTGGGWYPSLAMFAIALTSICFLRNSKFKAIMVSLLIGMLCATCLSLGYNFPLFKYLPMHNSLVTMRFLSFSVLIASILIVYVMKELILRFQGTYRFVGIVLIATILIFVSVDINPRLMPIKMNTYKTLQSYLERVSNGREPFEQGRLAWLSPSRFLGCQIAYFPMTKGLNMEDGWSIEGSPHNRAIWQHNIAIPADCNDYVVKNMYVWNVRTAFIDNNYKGLQELLAKRGFNVMDRVETITLFSNPTPSSYFMLQERDTLVIGKAAISMEMNFPWMIKGYSNRLEDYPPEYLKRFKLIYLIEPEVKDFTRFQDTVESLAEDGKIIIVSMGRAETWPLLDIVPYWEKIEADSDLKPTGKGPIQGEARLEADPTGQVPAMGNVDILWAVMQGSDKKVPAIGYKDVNGHKVYFVGLALGQQLNKTYGEQIRAILEQLMDLAHPNKNIIPAAFPVKNSDWKHDGFSFNYDSPQISPIQISVTYTPRWKALVDGKPWPVYNMENLIYMELPAGAHQVVFHYGMTWVGWLGIALSIFSLILVAGFYFCFNYFDRIFDAIKENARKSIATLGE
ncbi:MAG: 6-pyruvoyl-tetrahydropterin synthase-related protein [Syntrophomonas sp.]